MVSKNNRLERIRKIEEKTERHAIRKLAVGAASVLIGLAFSHNGGGKAHLVAASEINVSEHVTEQNTSSSNVEFSEPNEAQTENTNEHADAPPAVDESSTLKQENTVAQENQVTQESQSDKTEQVTEEVVDNPASSANTIETEKASVSVSDQVVQSSSQAPAIENTESVSQTEQVLPVQVESNTSVENTSQTIIAEENSLSQEDSQTSTKQDQKAPITEVPAVSTENSTKMSYDEAKEEVDKVNQEVNSELNNILDEASKVEGVVIEVNKIDPEKVFNTTVADIKINTEKLKEYTEDQIREISKTLKEYQDKLALAENKYNEDMAKYNEAKEAYIAELKKLGLWDDSHTDPGDLSQSLVIGKEENATVSAVSKHPSVVEGSGSILNGLLNNFWEVTVPNINGEFLEVTYSNLQNSSYADQKIGSIVITFSDWSSDYTGKPADKGGIYFGNCPTNGFFYKNSSGVTMDMKLYNSAGKLINLADNSAFITIGSLNSMGEGNDYVEKAEIINGTNHGGSGVALPESSVTIHKGPNGDVLYSDKNNEILSTTTALKKEEAIKIWGEDIVNKYGLWDDSTDRSKEIFGAGVFKVHGNGIKIRFSNKLGSAWATYSTSIPKLTFDMEKPVYEAPDPIAIIYTPGKLQLNANGTVHIHYVDVHDKAQSGQTSFVPEDGIHLDDYLQKIEHLAVGDNYENELWDYLSANYILATESVHPEATNGTIAEGEKHVYVYLKRKTESTSRDKVVNQTINYIYENGTTAAPTVNKTITFTQTGIVDLVTGEITWDGEWTPTQTFVTVVSPDIKGYHTDTPEVGPYDITVTNGNYDDSLDKVDTVVYKTNATETINRDKVVNQTIYYVYDDGTKAAETYTVQIKFTQTGTKDLVTGEETWDGEWTPEQNFVIVTSPKIDGYTANKAEVGPYNIKVTNDNYKDNLDKIDIVVYTKNAPQTETISRDKYVTQTIHYIYEDGTEAAPTVVKTIKFTQSGTKNLATGEENWNGEWTATQTFVVVVSPKIDGYTANRLEVGPYDITVTNDNYNDDLNKDDIVIYKKDATTEPEKPTDPEPTPTPDPEPTPETPAEPEEPDTSTVPEEPKEDDSVDIPPKDESLIPDDSNSSNSSDKSETEYLESEDETAPTIENPKKSTVNASSQYSSAYVKEAKKTSELTSVSTKSSIVENNSHDVATNEDTLPQTGAEETNKTGLMGLLIASLASTLGLAIGKKRKRN
ncbi:mucin-binding protein [Lactobacillus sp. PSON]|uniref:mucin-binding protein n=1 Tax=Lactobacillus sp. PSON TaxID=3455454 RepID=UPI004042A18E